MNAFIHFPINKTKFKCLIFPETFSEDTYQFRALQNSVSKRFHIGYLNSEDIGIDVNDINIDEDLNLDKVEQINYTRSRFPGPFYKSIDFSHKKGNLWLRRELNDLEELELWEKVYWASIFLEEYGEGDYDFIIVGDNWLKKFNYLPHRNTISFSDLKKIFRADNNAHRNYLVNPRETRPVTYDFFYTIQAFLTFYNTLTLSEIFKDPSFTNSFSKERKKDLYEAISSFIHRLKNVIVSYDEANYELFLPFYSSRTDYRISNFYSECISAIEELAKIILVLKSDEIGKDIFSRPTRLYHYRVKNLVNKEESHLKEIYNNLELKERMNILKTIRNKMQHGDAINIDDWRIQDEIIKVPELKLLHLDLAEDLMKEYVKNNNLYLTPFWWDEDEKEEVAPTGYRLPLRETLEFSFETVEIIINKITGAIIEDILENYVLSKNYENRWNLFKNYCKSITPDFFKRRQSNIFMDYTSLFN